MEFSDHNWERRVGQLNEWVNVQYEPMDTNDLTIEEVTEYLLKMIREYEDYVYQSGDDAIIQRAVERNMID